MRGSHRRNEESYPAFGSFALYCNLERAVYRGASYFPHHLEGYTLLGYCILLDTNPPLVFNLFFMDLAAQEGIVSTHSAVLDGRKFSRLSALELCRTPSLALGVG